jgi:hypothetical protein
MGRLKRRRNKMTKKMKVVVKIEGLIGHTYSFARPWDFGVLN